MPERIFWLPRIRLSSIERRLPEAEEGSGPYPTSMLSVFLIGRIPRLSSKDVLMFCGVSQSIQKPHPGEGYHGARLMLLVSLSS